MAQLLSTVARTQAFHSAALVHVCTYNADKSDLFPKAKATTASYHAATRELSLAEKQERCSPHLFVWSSVMEQMAYHAENDKI